MNVIIIGDGSVGDALIEFISKEGHNVTVIDIDPDVVNAVVNKYDVMGMTGNGASVDVQKEAGVSDCDVLISMAAGDELNLLCCMIGKQLGAKHTIARVREPQYSRQMTFMCQNLGIDMIVNPEYEAAREAARLIRFPSAMKLDKFAQGRVEMAEIHITENHPIAGCKLKDLASKFNVSVLVCVARRRDDVIIPGGDYIITAGDSISITASRKDISDFFIKTGTMGKHIKNVMVIGGDRISRYLASFLSGEGFGVKIIERDEEICRELSENLKKTTIIHGEATDPDILIEEGIDNAGACVALTSNDKTNIIISMFAKSHSVDKVITQVNSPSYLKLCNTAGIDSNITPRFIISAKILGYIRGIDNLGEKGSKSMIKTLYKLADNKVEALEFDVAEDFAKLSVPLKDIRLRRNVLIAAIIRDGNVIYPHGRTTLEIGDSVVVVTTNEKMYDLGDILA